MRIHQMGQLSQEIETSYQITVAEMEIIIIMDLAKIDRIVKEEVMEQ